jgi:hypothetical protein
MIFIVSHVLKIEDKNIYNTVHMGYPGDARGDARGMLSLSLYCHVFSVGM